MNLDDAKVPLDSHSERSEESRTSKSHRWIVILSEAKNLDDAKVPLDSHSERSEESRTSKSHRWIVILSEAKNLDEAKAARWIAATGWSFRRSAPDCRDNEQKLYVAEI